MRRVGITSTDLNIVFAFNTVYRICTALYEPFYIERGLYSGTAILEREIEGRTAFMWSAVSYKGTCPSPSPPPPFPGIASLLGVFQVALSGRGLCRTGSLFY